MNKIRDFFRLPVFSDYRTIAILWGVLAVVAALTKGGLDVHLNNFIIFRQVFWHMVDFKSLYAYYPEEYSDHNLYGPLFGIVIAPYALMPKFISLVCWLLSLCAVLYAAILRMPLSHKAKIFILWYVSNEVLGALFMAQFNIVIAALIIASYTAIDRDRNGWAAMFIMLGAMTKLYGILGLAFLPFSKHKIRLIGYCALWGVAFFVLPMLI